MKRCRGFTLLEMMVAISIFAVIAALSYGTLDQTTKIAGTLSRYFSRLSALQRTFSQLQRDVSGAMDRPVRDGLGDSEGALISRPDQPATDGEWLRITTTAPDVEYQHPVRVAWRLIDHTLYRITWQVLDRDQDSTEQARPMLEHVKSVAVQFLQPDANGELKSTDVWEKKQALPLGLTVRIEVQEGSYQRVFALAENFPNTPLQ